ncbi:MAG TPA: hypothetical protein PLL15_03250 [Syntrophales bacterium]|jgi:hypothetical protein|nr:hypothetical protein [Syntrophales bacterium]
MPDTRGNSIGESTITIKWWCVLLVIIGVFGWMFIAQMNVDRRVTTLETQYSFISQSITEVRELTKEIRADQLRRYRQETDGR